MPLTQLQLSAMHLELQRLEKTAGEVIQFPMTGEDAARVLTRAPQHAENAARNRAYWAMKKGPGKFKLPAGLAALGLGGAALLGHVAGTEAAPTGKRLEKERAKAGPLGRFTLAHPGLVGAAAGATGGLAGWHGAGAMEAGRYLPAAAMLLGPGMAVHGLSRLDKKLKEREQSEALSKSSAVQGETHTEDVLQQAQPEVKEAPPQKPTHPALTAAKYLGAYGLGTGLGYGAMYGLQKLRNKPLEPHGLAFHSIPALAGLGGLAFTHAQNMMFERMKEDALKRREMSGK